MSICCGIDIGSAYSSISFYNPDSLRIETIDLEHANGSKVIPSVVYFESGGNVVVGETACDAALTHPDRVFFNNKHFMENDHRTPFIDGREYTPQEIIAEILKVLKKDAESFLNEFVNEVVISAPAYFKKRQYQTIQKAAELVGLKVLEIIPDPHAAVLAFAIDRLKDIENNHIIVYDMGSGFFNVTLLMVKKEDLENTSCPL